MKMWKFTSLLIALFMVLAGTDALSQMQPPKPVLKFAANSTNGSNGEVTSTLYWYADGTSNPAANSFYIYYSEKSSDKLSDFTKLTEVKADANNNGLYNYTLTLRSSGGCFAITAVAYANGVVAESTPVYSCLNSDNKTYISFGNQPLYKGTINQEYYYYPKAYSNSTATIKYEMTADNGQKYTLNAQSGEFRWTPTVAGTYTFELKAYFADNSASSVQKWSVYVCDPNAPYIKITSTPAVYAAPGKEYVYQLVTESNVKCAVNYSFIGTLPDNASFDKTTGTLKWTPTQLQVITGAFKAELSCDNKVYTIQQFAIKGYSTDNSDLCATITGVATLDNGTIPTEGKVVAWRISPDSKVNPMYGSYIEKGTFSIKVPEGDYVLEFYGTEFEHSWFENASTFEKAKRFALKCNESVTIRVALKSAVKANYHTVTGNVSDASNNPVFAYIEFLPIQKTNDLNKANTQFITKTDSQGNYSISLPDNLDYKAHATPFDDTNYGDMYYNQVTSLFEADIIIVNKDLSGINFVVTTREKLVNGFAGRVIDENLAGIKSIVYATRLSTTNPSTKAVQFAAQTDDKGNYSFKSLPYGDYVLMSVPLERTYIPGYYKAGDFATTSWKEATKIKVTDVMNDMIVEIKHKLRPAIKGIIQIDGTVNKLNSLTIKGDLPQSEKSPLAGAFVYVIDSEGTLSDFGFTDENGNFSLTQLGQGQGTLYADAPGYNLMKVTIQADYQKNYKLSGYNFDMNTSLISTVTETIDGFNVYPSLTTNSITINFNSDESNAIIEIIDITGNLVYSENNNLANIGENTLKVNLNGLANGTYFVNVKSGNKSATSSIKIVK
jgi:hypothetical protein